LPASLLRDPCALGGETLLCLRPPSGAVDGARIVAESLPKGRAAHQRFQRQGKLGGSGKSIPTPLDATVRGNKNCSRKSGNTIAKGGGCVIAQDG